MARFLAWHGVCFGFQFESGFEFRLGSELGSELGQRNCRRRGQWVKDLARVRAKAIKLAKANSL